MGKVGIDWIKETVECDRNALVERFELSQAIYRKDPWAEHVQTKADRYRPLTPLALEAAE